MNKTRLSLISLCLLAGTFSNIAQADTQTVIPSTFAIQANAGDTIGFDVNYSSANPQQTTGLGLKLYYDSSKLSQANLSEVLPKDLLAQITGEDNNNGDGDNSTDKIINIAWAALSGNWPGTQSGDTKLLTVQFQVAQGLTSSTRINFTGDASAGNTFSASPVSITANDTNTNANEGESIQAEDEVTTNSTTDAGQTLAASSSTQTSSTETESINTSTTSGGGSLPWYVLLLLLVRFVRYRS